MSRLNDHTDFIKDNNIFFLDLELQTFRNYAKFVEDHFDNSLSNHEKEYKEIMAKIEQEPKKYADDYLNHLQDSLVDKVIEIDRDFVQSFRASMITQLFSFVERTIQDACNSYCLNHNKEFGLEDLRGNSEFEKAKLFLTRSAGVNMKELEPHWSYINNLRRVRNCIVHNNSTILFGEDKKLEILKAFSKGRYTFYVRGKDFESHNLLFDNKNFIDEIIDNIIGLFERLEKFEVYI
ncbi:hypothetical protein GCM10011531_01530 [Aquaticitalea lipolytica]|mgnify:CR=1 FL=1|jgi:hypothetical protein|uniref:Uncharacterized protein n=1 Tax=Aquaticitalea lipolytica TaxID=1247562 RepID=A0A8J2TJ99_9FLAO|nr:hypothetical protein [Aquaticitalea lipolytica]GFZ76261.1 hypothetical protein GCM10011531_01530 [Aquaticitalea lipolytica]|tara:strand:+ start:10252 stop:10959 length:708 start_codon:yes stop_codon:yes gene_type:complete